MCAARANLAAATSAARILGFEPNPEWDQVRRKIPILKFEDGVTREHAEYKGETVKQADANLLSYPLQEITDKAAIRRDLEYYSQRFDTDGPAMTHSILSIIYARLGMPEEALSMFKNSFRPDQRPPFGVLVRVGEGHRIPTLLLLQVDRSNLSCSGGRS